MTTSNPTWSFRRWAAQLGEQADAIDAFVSGSEREFAEFGSKLQACLRAAKSIGKNGQDALDFLTGRALEGILDRFARQLDTFERHHCSSDDVVNHITDLLRETLESLGKIHHKKRHFKGASSRLRLLSVLTKLEGSRLSNHDTGATSFASEIRRLGQEVAQRSDATIVGAQQLDSSLSGARASIVEGKARRAQRVEGCLSEIRRTFEAMSRMNQRALNMTSEIVDGSRELNESIEQIIFSLQSQDITRQRLEGVRDALKLTAEKLGAEESDEPAVEDGHAIAITLSDLQMRQLQGATEDFCGSVNGILAHIESVDRAAERISRELRALDEGSQGGEDTSLRELRRELENVLDVSREIEVEGERTSQELRSFVAIAEDTATIIQQLVSIGARFEMTALKAGLMATRTGDDGRALSAIAIELKTQCRDDQELTREVLAGLNEVVARIRELDEFVKTKFEALRNQAGETTGGLATLLDELETTSTGLDDTLVTIREDGRVVSSEMDSLGSDLSMHTRLSTLCEKVVAVLALVKSEAEEESQEELDPDKASAILEALAVDYTMDSQRLAHQQSTGQVDAETAVADDGEDNIEFF